LTVKECTAGTGDLCGSTFIDRNFDSLFAARMKDHYEKLSVPNRQRVVKNFENAKIVFRDAPGLGKYYVNVPTVADIEEAGVFGGLFEISRFVSWPSLLCLIIFLKVKIREEMRSLFDPVIDQIIDLIKHQVMTASQGLQRVNVSNILLLFATPLCIFSQPAVLTTEIVHIARRRLRRIRISL
jgi:hypothetical protein